MNFCSHCGAAVTRRVPAGDTLPRYVCDACETVHYQNPKIVAGCIPEWEDKILLCRRAIEPRHGLWTLPAGFMEKGETTLQAAARETLEEAGARVEVGPLYTVFSLPHIDQVYLFYRGRLTDLDYAPGSESLEVDLFHEHVVPWGQLAFRVVRETLKLYYQDRRTGQFRTHVGDIVRMPGTAAEYEVSISAQDG
ncbi:MAG: NUDIX hydrolase [Acidiferrobacterales bacterium]|nr:NUDIX hydrolase [Gammaproteobacteria bacterium]